MIQIQSGTASIVEGKLHRGNEPKQFVYLHGGDICGAAEASGRNTAEILDFSANINPLGMPPGVREAIIESLDLSLIHILSIPAIRPSSARTGSRWTLWTVWELHMK